LVSFDLRTRGAHEEAAMDTCAHEGCNCDFSKSYVERDGKRYCSEACADGQSCGPGGCNCGDAAE
jgi:hypothetical protein